MIGRQVENLPLPVLLLLLSLGTPLAW